jgi:hypothetical protein
LKVVTADLHDSMKRMWSEYITARKQAAEPEPSSSGSGKRAWRPSPEVQRQQEEARQKAVRACEEMEPHWELALRLLTRVFTNARGNFACFEYRFIPDKWDSWLVRLPSLSLTPTRWADRARMHLV